MDLAIILILNVMLFACEGALLVYRFNLFMKRQSKTVASIMGISTIATCVLFTGVAAVLIVLTQKGNPIACEAAIVTCVFLYTATKGQLYLFFIERMYIVYRKPNQSRMDCPVYLINMCLLLPYGVIVVLMVMYRVSYIDQHDTCRIGLENESALPLLVYDTIFSNYAIAVFVWPLCKNRNVVTSSGLITMAKRNAVGSILSTISSFLNIFSIYYQKRQRAESCFLYCTLDVMVNVLVMNYLISRGKKTKSSKIPDDNTSSFTMSYYPSVTADVSTVTKSNSSRIHPETQSTQTSVTCLIEYRTDEEACKGLVDAAA
jgi:hypothetical protein